MRLLILLLVVSSSLNSVWAAESNANIHNGELFCFKRKRAIRSGWLYGEDSHKQIPFAVSEKDGFKLYSAELTDVTERFAESTVESSARFTMTLSPAGDVIEPPKLVVQYKDLGTGSTDLKETIYSEELIAPQIRLNASTAYSKSSVNPVDPTMNDSYDLLISCLATFYVGQPR